MNTRARGAPRRKRAVDLRDAQRLSHQSFALAGALFGMMWADQAKLRETLQALAKRVAHLESKWASAGRRSMTRGRPESPASTCAAG